MVTPRLPADQLIYRRRRVNEMLRERCFCPACQVRSSGALRVIKWRATGIRFECTACGLRFTLARPLATAPGEARG